MDFQTFPILFSPDGLDAGTRAMLTCVQFMSADKILDLGCGYGVVGIYAAKLIGEENVTMVDITPRSNSRKQIYVERKPKHSLYDVVGNA